MNFHEKHFHKKKLTSSGFEIFDGDEDSDKQREQFCCQEEGCFSKNGRRKVFKTYPAFKQHYMLVHATRVHECTKCGRKFSDMSKQKQHEFNCGLKLTCSCGVAYHGKRGLLAHVKLTSHKLPDSVKQHFIKSPQTISGNTTIKRLRRKPGITNQIPRSRTPIPILPKGNVQPQIVCIASSCPTSQPQIVLATNPIDSTCNSCGPNTKSAIRPVNLLRKRRYIIDVLMPQDKLTCFDEPHANPKTPSLQASKIDSLSTAMLTSGIKSCILRKPDETENEEHCKKSQTDQSVGNQQPAQDFSCQTEEFLSWLDAETAKCNHTSGNPTANICTQTLQSLDSLESDMNFHVTNSTQSRNVAQIETQTDDDWIAALFQEDNPSSAGGHAMMFAQQNPSDGPSGSTYSSVLPEMSCNIQTQTNFIESIAHVTTQTTNGACMDSNGTDFADTVLSYIVSDSQTQTDRTYDVSVDTAHTQTAFGCDDIVQFLNIQTQTDLYNQQDLGPLQEI